MLTLDSKIPQGPIEEGWTNHKNNLRLVGPKNRPNYKVLVVGSGLAGAAAILAIVLLMPCLLYTSDAADE